VLAECFDGKQAVGAYDEQFFAHLGALASAAAIENTNKHMFVLFKQREERTGWNA
jgi:hypothetical protein